MVWFRSNRIKEAHHYRNFDFGAGTWTGAIPTGHATAYDEAYTYDPNGNIKSLLRNGKPGTVSMDNLTYNYTNGTNRLKWIDETVSAGTYNDDLDDQGNSNYSYDEIGQLISDAAEGITSIEWDAYNKVTRVNKNCAGCTPIILFFYDGMGNRIMKKVYQPGSTDMDATIYVRDASGNVEFPKRKRNPGGCGWNKGSG